MTAKKQAERRESPRARQAGEKPKTKGTSPLVEEKNQRRHLAVVSQGRSWTHTGYRAAMTSV